MYYKRKRKSKRENNRIKPTKHKVERGNWYEGLRQVQKIMFPLNTPLISSGLNGKNFVWNDKSIKWYLEKRGIKSLKTRKITRKNITYCSCIIQYVHNFDFRDYESISAGQGVIEITAVDFMDT